MPKLPNQPKPATPAQDEHDFWRRQNLWIGVLAPITTAVLVAGVVAWVQSGWQSGIVLVVLGLVGSVVTAWLVMKKDTHHPVGYLAFVTAVTVAVITWIIVGTDICDRHQYTVIKSTVCSRLERPLSDKNARLEIQPGNVLFRKNAPQFNINYPTDALCLDIKIVNQSSTVATGGILFGQPHAIERAQTGRHLDMLFDLSFDILSDQMPTLNMNLFVNERQPNFTAHTGTCISAGAYNSAIAAKQYIYFPLLLLWRDDAMIGKEVGVTEICGYFVASAVSFNECPNHNRSYILDYSSLEAANGNSR